MVPCSSGGTSTNARTARHASSFGRGAGRGRACSISPVMHELGTMGAKQGQLVGALPLLHQVFNTFDPGA